MNWLDDIDLAPDGSSLQMGTRALGSRPWLIRDDHYDAEIALKTTLTKERRNEVFGLADDLIDDSTRESCEQIRHLTGGTTTDHPLLSAGLAVQEDLCVMVRHSEGWLLAGASLHFPNRWRLCDKLGQHVTAIHSPVAGYESRLARRVDALFDAVGTDPVWRRNWFLHVDDDLFQPIHPPHRLVPADRCGTDITIRSERQSLRRVGQALLFTIKTQRATLAQLLSDPARQAAFRRYVFTADPVEQQRRAIHPEQIRHLRDHVLAAEP